MKVEPAKWAAAIVVTAVIWGVSGYFAGQYIAFRLADQDLGPPSAVHDIQLERLDIESGGLITYTMQVTRLRGECSFMGRDHYLRPVEGEDVFLLNMQPAQQLRTGQALQPDAWFDVPVPHDVSGVYRFFIDFKYRCPGSTDVSHVYSPFRVVRVR